MPRRLKIGVDAHVLTGKYQGTRTTLANLLRAVARQGGVHEVTIYSEDPAAAAQMIGVSDFHYGALEHCGPIKRLLYVFPRIFARDKIDVAVFQYNISPFTRTRQMTFVHDILPLTHTRYFPFKNRARIRFFQTLSVLLADGVVTVSDYSKGIIAKYFRLKPDDVSTVFNGPSFSTACYEQGRQEHYSRYILAVGRIEERKNVPLLVRAFLKANLPDVRLVIVGAPDLGFDYSFPENDQIDHRSGLDEADLIALYRGASLFVYPSAAEGFGLPLLDALLFGLPVISSDQTAMKEIADGAATLFDPTRADAEDVLAGLIGGHFRDAPVTAVSDPQREILAQRYNWDRAARDFLAAVERVARTGSVRKDRTRA